MSQVPELLREIRACRLCEAALPHGPRPLLAAEAEAVILIAGQAPGRRVHESGILWEDPSGDRLREWMGIDRATFYDPKRVALVPMGFCYPGSGRSGDLPPRVECRQTWHPRLVPQLENLKLKILVGQYAQAYHLGDRMKSTLTENVAAWPEFFPPELPIPHPSPRNKSWLKRNPWFEVEVLPRLRTAVAAALET